MPPPKPARRELANLFSVKKTMAAADKADPTIRYELGLVACTLSAMQLAWYSGLVKNDRQ